MSRMKPVRLPAAATIALPRWALYGLGLLYILPGLIGRDIWKDDAGSFGIMWTMAHGGINDWLYPNIAGLANAAEGPLAFWFGALCIKLFGWAVGDLLAARVSTVAIFAAGVWSVWYAAFHLGRRTDAQPLRLAFGGQPEPNDYGRTLADTAVLIYIGCLGLLLHSHETLAVTLQGTLVAYFVYRAVRYVEKPGLRNAALVGLSLGGLVLTRGWVAPAALALALAASGLFMRIPVGPLLRDMGAALLTAAAIALVWILPASLVQPYGLDPVAAWNAWNREQVGLPGERSLGWLLRTGLWYFWPAWPFAGWAVWAWRYEKKLLHIVLPLAMVTAMLLLLLFQPSPANTDLLKLLPPLAIMAAFGLPTMKRGAINAIDWFSVMVLTTLGALVWLFYVAKLTGWPRQFSHNVLKLLPGHTPEFLVLPFIVAASVSVGWVFLILWRVSRQPSVLWRAVVLSSGGLIMLWVLTMTLFLPELNYGRTYAGVAHQIAERLPDDARCLETNVGPAQRASFAFFGKLPFTDVSGGQCDYLLLQDSLKRRDSTELDRYYRGKQWAQIWEGRRAGDRDERFRLYRRAD